MRISQAYYTPEEYITLERKAIPDAKTVRSEYINGKIIGRSSSNWAHNVITGNIVAGLYTRLKIGSIVRNLRESFTSISAMISLTSACVKISNSQSARKISANLIENGE